MTGFLLLIPDLNTFLLVTAWQITKDLLWCYGSGEKTKEITGGERRGHRHSDVYITYFVKMTDSKFVVSYYIQEPNLKPIITTTVLALHAAVK